MEGPAKTCDTEQKVDEDLELTPQMGTSSASTDQMAKDISKINELLKQTSEVQESKLNAVQMVTRAVETKLLDLTIHLGNAKSHIVFLEDANKALEANPPASCAEVEDRKLKVDDLENRCWQNNLHFVGFPESCEGSDVRSFMCDTLPQLLQINFPDRLHVDWGHRSFATRKPDSQRQSSRAIIFCFLRFWGPGANHGGGSEDRDADLEWTPNSDFSRFLQISHRQTSSVPSVQETAAEGVKSACSFLWCSS